MFTDGVQWLRANAVLLPGVTTLARVVARVREEATHDLYATLAGLPSAYQRAALEHLVVVPDGARYSDLERWRKVLWNTRYISAALDALRAQGYPVLDEDVARLSPFVREHVNVVGKYSFLLPDLGEAGIRQLRDPDAADDELPN
jgi:hypothetical protein